MIDSNSLHQNIKRFRFDQSPSSSIPQIKKPKPNITKIASIYIKTLDIPLVSKTLSSSTDSIHLRPYKPYTFGRNTRSCDFIFKDRQVSKQHFQLYFDELNEKVFIADGVFWLCSSQFSGVRVSLNGVFVDGVRIGEGRATEICAGNEVSLVCENDGFCSVGDGVRVGFVVERIVFMEEVVDNNVDGCVKNGLCLDNDTFSLGCGGLGVASVLLSRCRKIMSSSDPVWYIREHVASSYEMRAKFVRLNRVTTNSCFMRSNFLEFGVTDALEVNHCEELANDPSKDTCFAGTSNLDLDFSSKKTLEASEKNRDLVYEINDPELQESAYVGVPSNSNANDKTRGIFACEEDFPQMNELVMNRSRGVRVPPPGNKFYLNCLGQSAREDEICVSLPELLHPVETLVQIFIATFTSDITWFLSYCEIPAHLPVTIACHNTERCWSSSSDKRTSIPYSGFPNLVVVYPPFPESIAFGKDRRRHGIACHHPKLFVLQRKDCIRVILTSANLVAKQWHRVTNTVWWQDFPRASAPDYMSLFTQSSGEEMNRDSKSDFAAQLAGFMASLVADAPGQDHWIMELAKYDFQGAAGHLVASVPGIYCSRHPYISDSTYYLCGNSFMPSRVELLGSVEASVVGISHLFRTSVDSRGAQLKKLTTILGNCHVNAYSMLEIILRRNRNILADPNAVSVVIANSKELSEGDCVQLGFLPRNVAKWVAPLSDSGLFAFSAYLYPKEVLASAFEGSNNKVQLILYVSKGPNFSNLSEVVQPAHGSAICSLVASIQRCGGLWRLHEVLGHYKWPENSETDFSFGSSSIGAVNAQFLAAFSAATGKRSRQFPDSEESDPDWGCWSASQESRHPSIRIIFPTIERVKTATCGIFASKYLLCFSQKTWLRLRTLGILHDAVPYPVERVGHPMHVKVARRRFRSKMDTSSCGWVYCGSHNFSAAAWGRPLGARSNSVLGSRLHISNYELGIVFIVPPPDTKNCTNIKCANLDDIVMPFVVPAPKYSSMDKPATKLAMREALTELSVEERAYAEEEEESAVGELVEEEMPDEEEMVIEEASDFIAHEKEDEKIYAEALWVQVDSCES